MDILEHLRAIQHNMRQKYGDTLKRKTYIMTWSSWCKVRLDLKAAGIPIEYRRVARHKWRRFVAGNEVMLSKRAAEGKIFALETPDYAGIILPKTNVTVYSVDDAVG